MKKHDLIRPGTVVRYKDEKWVILDIASIESVLAKHLGDQHQDKLPANELVLDRPKLAGGTKRPDLALIAADAWKEANTKLDLIRPLIDAGRWKRTREEVMKVAQAAGKHYVTIYRWIDAYESTGLLSSLLRQERKDRGNTRLDERVEAIIKKAIDEKYLTSEQPDPSDLMDEIRPLCKKAGIKAPHINTVRRRIALLSPELKMSKRLGPKAAVENFKPIEGSFPGADYPLAVVQIDHTPADIMLVDDVTRLPINRPYLTLAIDVFSRMVVGFYLSLDPPGALSTGLCLSHAILSKEKWLAQRGIDAKWPCWGRMRMVHADNAKEFRGTMLAWACKEHGITMENRPKGMPRFGGHVERGFRTFLKKMHRIKGTTFSNTKEKLDYDSEGRAILTLAEFEKWFTIYIVKKYHHELHRGINTTPYRRWEEGLLGDKDHPGIGLPARIENEEQLRLDFLPYVERTVQEYGVVIEDVNYYSDVLRKWIHAPDNDDPNKKRKFIFRRDFRDISVIHFFDPDTRTYADVPYRDSTHPPISVWELRAAKRRLTEKGLDAVNEQLIFEAVAEMREIEQEAEKKTKAARRQNQRRRENDKAKKAKLKKASPGEPTATTLDDEVLNQSGLLTDLGSIQPFDDIEAARTK